MTPIVRPPVAIALLMVAMTSIQIGAATAKGLFPEVGAVGVSALRLAFAALIVLVVFRPWRSPPKRRDWPVILVYGLALGAMNLLFYLAISRIPLGVAVGLEFAGPLSVALVSARRPLDLVWVGLAVAGLIMLTPLVGGGIDPLGAVLAMAAGGFWAVYILFGQKAGDAHGAGSAAWGMLIAALLVFPIGVIETRGALFSPAVLPGAFAVALLSSALPYSLEMIALRALPAGTFGVLMSAEPALGALSGGIILHERLSPIRWLAIIAVVAASAGAGLTLKPRKPLAPEP